MYIITYIVLSGLGISLIQDSPTKLEKSEYVIETQNKLSAPIFAWKISNVVSEFEYIMQKNNIIKLYSVLSFF